MQLQQIHGIATFINKVTVHILSHCYSVAKNLIISHISTLACSISNIEIPSVN